MILPPVHSWAETEQRWRSCGSWSSLVPKNEALGWPCGNNIQSYATIMWKMLSSFRLYPVKLVASTHHQKYWSIGIIIPGRKEIRRTNLSYFVWSRMVSIKIFKTMLTCDTYSDINSEICSHIFIYLIRLDDVRSLGVNVEVYLLRGQCWWLTLWRNLWTLEVHIHHSNFPTCRALGTEFKLTRFYKYWMCKQETHQGTIFASIRILTVRAHG